MQAKALLGIVRDFCPNEHFFLRRAEGPFFVDRRPLVAVQILSQEESRLSWKHVKREALGIDDNVVDERFKNHVKEGGEPWS